MTVPESLSRFHKALHLFKDNKFDEAAKVLEEVLAKNPNDQDALEALGVIYGKLNRLDDAVDLMKRLIKINPDHIMAHTNLSQFYMLKKMIQEAEVEQAESRRLSWKAELKAKKMSDTDIQKLSLEDEKTQAEGILRKIEQYKKVIEFDPKDVLGYFTLGTAYLQAKRFQEAADTFKKAVEVGPEHSPSYSGYGEALEALGLKDEAIKIYKAGVPVADKKGDIIPLRKMENRLRKLT